MDTQEHIRHARITYSSGSLGLEETAADPFVQAAQWLGDATAHPDLIEPNAMTLATVDQAGQPSARIVLLRGYDERGFVFFTNYLSRKGSELDATKVGALLFYWDRLERELRIEGRVERLPPSESDDYFAQRPRGHRLSAWASPQSQVVDNREALEAGMAQVEARFSGDEVPRPAHWGGYRVVPARFEFWQGRPNRLHDRLQYDRLNDDWTISRLAP